MSPFLALLLTLAFTGFLFRRDLAERPPVTGALWIPLVWLLIICSRYVSQWFGFGGAIVLEEGSSLDAAVFLSLQLMGLLVLHRRRVRWSAVVSRNPWLVAFLVFGLVSILWSDFPFVAFKRWVKVLSHPIMFLVIATEPDARAAFVHLMKRAAYILVPFSILLIKYYPDLGRGFDLWTGLASNTGVTTNKNELGADCLVLGLFFAWYFLTLLRGPDSRGRRSELILSAGFLGMIGWLLFMAQSATSMASLALGVFTMLVLGLRFVRRNVGTYAAVGLLLLLGVEIFFGLTNTVAVVLGRDATLTGRVDLWAEVSMLNANSLLGAGFESFWLGGQIERLWAEHWWRPNQAHNGYLETYLTLGWIGLILLAGWILSSFRKACRTLASDFDSGRLALAVIVTVVAYNYTEAAFKALHPVWFAFFIASMGHEGSEFSSAPATLPSVLATVSHRGPSRPPPRTSGT